jgi:hypothetical protein
LGIAVIVAVIAAGCGGTPSSKKGKLRYLLSKAIAVFATGRSTS